MKTTTGYFACAVLALCGAVFTPACSSAVAEEGASEGKIGTAEAELTGVKTANDLKIVGSLDGTSATATFAYSNPPLYRAYKFGAYAGDKLDIWVRSTNGDAMAWVLNNSLTTVAQNDDAITGAPDSHVTFTAKTQGTKSAPIITHYLVVREFSKADATFTVTFNKSNAPAFFACRVDADCVATTAPTGCCNNGTKYAVNASEVTAWKADNACTPGICPMYIKLDNRVAECNTTTNACEMVAPSDIVCQAYSLNSHSCPAGFNCAKTDARTDVGGKCVETCGGITGKQCSGFGDVCVDDPSDSCDPAHGGADCGGICQPKPACVNTKLCVRTSHFDATACACVPNPVCGGTAQTHCDAQYSACIDDPNGNCHLGGGNASCTGLCAN